MIDEPRRLPAGLDEFPEDAKARLALFVSLLERWQRTHNLIAASTVSEIWERHVADSAQLAGLVPDFLHWVDLGSGGGFPGLVMAIVFAEDPARRFTLVEASAKKAAFLRIAARETGVRAEVVNERIESFGGRSPAIADVVSARALASLRTLLHLAHPLLMPEGKLVLLKGREFTREVEEAADAWHFDLVVSPSRVDSSGCIAVVTKPEPKR